MPGRQLLLGLLLAKILGTATSLAAEWTATFVPNHNGAPPQLQAIWAASARDVYAVGSGLTSDFGTGGLIYHYNDNAWTVIHTVARHTELFDVWGSGPSDVYAVGYRDPGDGRRGLILHFDGTNWSELPYPGTVADFRGVWGVSAQNVFVVGSRAILRKQGGSFQTALEISFFPRAVWGASTSSVFVVGLGGFLRFDGAEWRYMLGSGNLESMTWGGLGGSSASDVYAAGNVLDDTTRAMRYDGNADDRWAELTAPQGVSAFRDVWAAGPGNVFFVGNGGVYRFDGSSFHLEATPPRGLTGIYGLSSGEVFATGGNGLIFSTTLPPPPPELELDADVVQTITEPATLVTGKPIYVRAYVTCPNCNVPTNFDVAVTMTAGSRADSLTKRITLDKSYTVPELRLSPLDSFNFIIPPADFEISSGTKDLSIELSLSRLDTTVLDTWSRTISVQALEPLTIVWVPIKILNTDDDSKFSPTAEMMQHSQEFLRLVYPGRVRFIPSAGGPLSFDVTGIASGSEDDFAQRQDLLIQTLNQVFLLLALVSGEPSSYGPFDYVHGHVRDNSGGPSMAGLSDSYWKRLASNGATGVGYVSFSDERVYGAAHEIGHSLGLQHPGWLADANQPDQLRGVCPDGSGTVLRSNEDPNVEWKYDWPYQNAHTNVIGLRNAPWEVMLLLRFDFMSYCGEPYMSDGAGGYRDPNVWVSKTHYDRLVQKLLLSPRPHRAGPGGEPWRRLGRLPDEQAIFLTASTRSSYRVVTAAVHRDGTAEDLKALALGGNLVLPRSNLSPSATNWCVQTLASSVVEDEQCFELGFADADFRPVDRVSLQAHMNQSSSTDTVRLLKGSAVLATLTKSASAPQVSGITLDTSTPGQVAVRWDATDADGDALRYAVLYSRDGGTQWFPLAVELTAEEHVQELAALPASGAGRFQVLASDGFNETTAVGVSTLVVQDRGPRIELLHPETVHGLALGDAFLLSATAFDLEDGELAAAALTWRNAQGTVVGSGDALVSIAAEEAAYTVTATDSASKSSTRSVKLAVGGPVPAFGGASALILVLLAASLAFAAPLRRRRTAQVSQRAIPAPRAGLPRGPSGGSCP